MTKEQIVVTSGDIVTVEVPTSDEPLYFLVASASYRKKPDESYVNFFRAWPLIPISMLDYTHDVSVLYVHRGEEHNFAVKFAYEGPILADEVQERLHTLDSSSMELMMRNIADSKSHGGPASDKEAKIPWIDTDHGKACDVLWTRCVSTGLRFYESLPKK